MDSITRPPEPVLQCMDMIGGNQLGSYLVHSPGLDVWVDSLPHGAEAGGDVHLLSVCGSGRVTRMVMADVAGHGATSQETARLLRRLVREQINLLDQSRLVRNVNREFYHHTQLGRFATVLFMTFFSPTGHLIVCNAGHPAPFHFSTRLGQWRLLDHHAVNPGPTIRQEKVHYGLKKVANLPLGIIEPTEFVQFETHLATGDILVAFSDALTEATAPGDRYLGEAGLLEMLENLPRSGPDVLGPALLAEVARFRGGLPPHDDQTLLVALRTAAPPPRLDTGLLRRLAGKLFRPVSRFFFRRF